VLIGVPNFSLSYLTVKVQTGACARQIRGFKTHHKAKVNWLMVVQVQIKSV